MKGVILQEVWVRDSSLTYATNKHLLPPTTNQWFLSDTNVS